MTEQEQADLVIKRTFGVSDDADLTENEMQELRDHDDACMRFFVNYGKENSDASQSSV